MKHLMITTALVCAASGAAYAGELTYGSAEATYFDFNDSDLETLSGEFDYVSGELSFTGAAGYATGDIDDAYVIDLSAGYAIMPGLTVYGSLAYADQDNASDETAYGLGVEYQTANYGVALDYLYFDEADTDVVTLGGYYGFGASTVYAAYADADDAEGYMLGYTYEASNWDFDLGSTWADDFDNGLTAIASSYDVNSTITLGVSLVSYNEDFADYGLATFGGTYNFTDTVSLEANYVTSFGYDDNTDGFGLALKFETGSRRLRVMDQIDYLASDATPLYDLLDY